MESPRSYPGPLQTQKDPHHKNSPPNLMASASLVTGILAALTFFYFPFPVVFSAASIILALLSKKESSFRAAAKAGIIISIIAFIAYFFLVITFYGLGTSKDFYNLYQESGSERVQTNIDSK